MNYKARISLPDLYVSLAEKTCIMPISIGQEYHEDAKLKACIHLVSKHFNACHIVVCDSLQRHTLQIKNPSFQPEELYTLSLKLGTAWIDRNKETLKQFSIPYNISRWDDWLKNSDYNNAKHKINTLYETNTIYKKALQNSAELFYQRSKQQKEQLVEKDIFISLSIKYIQEECAVLLLLQKTHCNCILYPGSINDAFYITYQNLIYPEFPNFLLPIHITIKKQKGTL